MKLVSSDLNGTLVHQHTMSDMIRLYIGEKEFQEANRVFKKQTAGTASIEEAFATAGPLTRGLTLRQAIEYTTPSGAMRYVNGFTDFINALTAEQIPLVINSTGYSVTIEAIKAQIGASKIHGDIGNKLIFGVEGSTEEELSDAELREYVRKFFVNPNAKQDPVYDQIKAVGRVELGIVDEADKADLLLKYAAQHWPRLSSTEVLHMGDTMGDSVGIYEIALAGGVGVAFNYNDALDKYLYEKMLGDRSLENHIFFACPKGHEADLTKVLPLLSL